MSNMSKEAPPAAELDKEIPYVRYLDLSSGQPHLLAEQCTACSARYFDIRMACARCGGRSFEQVALPTEGTVGSFTIIHRAAPGVVTPFVSAVVYLSDSTAVKANIVGCPPDPDHVQLGMPVRLTTFTAAVGADGTHAIAFAFAPTQNEEVGT